MLGQLLESSPKRVVSRRSTVVSILGHALVLSGAVAAAHPVRNADPPETVTTLYPPVPLPPPRCDDCGSRSRVGRPGRGPIPVVPVPPRTPDRITLDLPGTVAPPDEGVVISAEEWRGSSGEQRDGTTESVLGPGSVDREVVPLATNPVPRYPAELRAARIEGTVQARFVVDTTGRVIMGSVILDASEHPAFGHAVIEALRRSRYEPAQLRGRQVRQLVSQSFLFQLRD